MNARIFVATALLAACGRPPPEQQPPPAPVFTPEPAGDGAALFTRAELSGDSLTVTVLGKKLGPVLGYAFRLEVQNFSVTAAATAEHALGDDAVYLTARGGLAVGGARKGVEAPLDDETVLSTVKLHLDATPATLRLADTSVRRANGDGVAFTAAGGLVSGGAL